MNYLITTYSLILSQQKITKNVCYKKLTSYDDSNQI